MTNDRPVYILISKMILRLFIWESLKILKATILLGSFIKETLHEYLIKIEYIKNIASDTILHA